MSLEDNLMHHLEHDGRPVRRALPPAIERAIDEVLEKGVVSSAGGSEAGS